MNFLITVEELLSFKKDYQLTNAELEILAFICNGLAIKEIARHRQCSINTVKTHIKSLFLKTDAHSQQDLIIKTFRHQIQRMDFK